MWSNYTFMAESLAKYIYMIIYSQIAQIKTFKILNMIQRFTNQAISYVHPNFIFNTMGLSKSCTIININIFKHCKFHSK